MIMGHIIISATGFQTVDDGSKPHTDIRDSKGQMSRPLLFQSVIGPLYQATIADDTQRMAESRMVEEKNNCNQKLEKMN